MTLHDKTLQRRKPMRVAGLALRTDNASESQPQTGKIPELWERFRIENWFERLERLGAFGPPLGVYSAYESDASGSFQIMAGREIAPNVKINPPLVVVSVPAGSYRMFESRGSLPQSVVRGWEQVWAYFERPGAPARAYTYDVEVYPSAESVEIWIAVQD